MVASPVTAEDQIVQASAVPYRQLVSAFDQADAASQARVGRLDVRIAGFHVCVRIAGGRLSDRLCAALDHLPAAGGGAPDLCIDAMDGSEVPGFSYKSTAGGGRAGILLKSSDDGRFIGEVRDHTEIWLDRQRNHIVGWFHSGARLNLDERARPFHKMLSTWLEERGVQFIHAGLITCRDLGLLFVGNGGAGKSTSSIACMKAGMGYLGDDFIGFSADGEGFVGHGIYGTCLLNTHHIRRFPELERISEPPNHDFEDKRIMYLHRDYRDRLASEVRLRALLLPRVVDTAESRVRRASKAQALMAIAPTSVMFLPRPNKAAFGRLTALVEALPCYWLELGQRLELIPSAVDELSSSL